MVVVEVIGASGEEDHDDGRRDEDGTGELVRKAQAEPGLDVLREGVRVLAEALMELEVTQHVGAERHARSVERTGQRNG